MAGGNGYGNAVNQLYLPCGLDIDDDNQIIVIADWNNHRIVEWKMGASHGKVIAGDQSQGNRTDQLYNGQLMFSSIKRPIVSSLLIDQIDEFFDGHDIKERHKVK